MTTRDRDRILAAFADLSDTVRARALELFELQPSSVVGGMLLAMARSRDFLTQTNEEQLRRLDRCLPPSGSAALEAP